MIGSMKDRINAKILKKNSNGRGGWNLEEIELGTFWGNIEPLSARNIVQYRQGDLNTNTKITMRANAQITKESVFYARGQKFLIESILEKNGFYEIMAVGEKIHG